MQGPHRADIGLSILRKSWGLGIVRPLLQACIECVEKADYERLVLTVAAENERALAMYRKAGFVEFGRNPKGFRFCVSGYQEVVSMLQALPHLGTANDQKY